jgi:hypothetical protein
VRDESGAEYFLDGGDTASASQSLIDDHQVRPASGGGGHRIDLGGRDRTDIVAHGRQQFGKQHGDNDLVFHYQDTERFDRVTSLSRNFCGTSKEWPVWTIADGGPPKEGSESTQAHTRCG